MKLLRQVALATLVFMAFFAHAQNVKPITRMILEARDAGNQFKQVSLFSPIEGAQSKFDKVCSDVTVAQVSIAGLKRILSSNEKTLRLVIPFKGQNVLIDLKEAAPLTDDFVVTTADSKGQPVAYERGRHFRGIVANDNNSVAAFSIFNNEIMGMFSSDALGDVSVARTEGGANEYVIYSDDDLKIKMSNFCQTEDDHGTSNANNAISGEAPEALINKCVRVYFEADNALYVNKGSNVTNTTNYVTGMFNNVATIYQNEDISTTISQVFVWTTLDSYSRTSSSTALNQFRTTRTSFTGDLAHLVALGGNNLGGVAYLDVLCNSGFRYAYSNIAATYNNFPTYSWTIMVVTHEMGHNLGSPHTQSCTWPGGAIDNCFTTEGGCAPGPAPVNGGTIMSYCHLTSNGINLSNGFGPLPGGRIRDRVTAAACLSSTVCGTTNTPPTVSITSPANGATFVAPASITINATATDADGTIASVAFYRGTTLLGTDNTAPYSFTWTNVAAGTYSLTAIATDNNSASTTSTAVSVTVQSTNTPPTVSITSPTTGTTYNEPASITINATAADTDGSVTSVSFFNGTTLLGTDNTAPYSFTWSNVADGTYSLTARATDNNNGTTTSNPVSVTVLNNVPPQVSMVSPTNNAVFIAPATVGLAALASDSDGTIAKVEFYQGTTLIGTSTTGSRNRYAFNWTNVPVGNYTITAIAFDNFGMTTTSSAINISVVTPNAPPTVSITSPANNATFSPPATINITATAADTDGSVTSVAFYNGSTLLGTDNTAPYSFNWTNVPTGTYALTAIATDNGSASTTSSVVNITVVNQLPTVSITSPTNGASFVAPASVVINATAVDPDGSVAKVDFYNGNTLIGTDNTAPYSFTWTGVGIGSYAISARATDNNNAVGTSTTVNISVTSGNIAPSVSITSPTNNAEFIAPANITINATANDIDGSVTRVEFYSGTTLIGTDNAAPYSFSWTNVPIGTYSLTAKAFDDGGATTTSTAVNVVVKTNNQPPVVSITSPANNAVFTAPANITLRASASDPDGFISKVEFYRGTTLIGTSFTGGTRTGFTVAWTNVGAGSYVLTAKAYDDGGAVTTSSAVNITVNPAVGTLIDGNTEGGVKMNLSPNPAKNFVQIQTIVSEAGNYDLTVFNAAGTQMLYRKVNLVKGTNNDTIETSNFAKGIYLVRISNAEGKVQNTQKLMVD